MANEDPGGNFVAADFYADLRAVMVMAMPGSCPDSARTRLLAGEAVPVADFGSPDPAEDWPTFLFAPSAAGGDVDETGEPWDWQAAGPPPDPMDGALRVACSVVELAVQSTRAVGTPVGAFNSDRGIIVLFEPEYTQVAEFVEVRIGGASYLRGKQLRPVGLFDAGVRRIELDARDT